MTHNQHTFEYEMEVRDHELDAQGIVNNAHYLHYLEHARHKFLNQRGLDFVALAQQGLNLVVVRVEVDYLASLRSGDRFMVTTSVERVSRLRFAFAQQIVRLPDSLPMIRARVIGTALNAAGRPVLSEAVERLLSG